MRSFIYTLIAVTALSSGLYAQRLLSAESATEPTAGALTESFPDLEGKPHRLDEWRGKTLVVNFWATWCTPCLEEMPAFSALQNELGGRGLQIVGLAIDDPVSVKRFLAKHPTAYPLLIAESGEGLAANLGNKLGVLPFTAIFDATGKLVEVKTGPYKGDELRKAVEPLLAKAGK
ncbi:TlpA disulfide reductase family protein [Methylococcus sp. EFPC2]|uniref:TlpA family protein disulfide reductase n=1 Tax=Methylococcus sp. EFPC2 TaxID=2812648 RepID=UPI001967C75C|nr:TlpA disulfide reductase family protein [Methylococcus sp. EFPC2]QSA96991.1 TlpA family protein disulfide reductase [Methylococcus sp. EFPC2]